MHPGEREYWRKRNAYEAGLGFKTQLVLVLIMLGLGVAWEVYKWNDCRKVGHGFMYCVANIGPGG